MENILANALNIPFLALKYFMNNPVKSVIFYLAVIENSHPFHNSYQGISKPSQENIKTDFCLEGIQTPREAIKRQEEIKMCFAGQTFFGSTGAILGKLAGKLHNKVNLRAEFAEFTSTTENKHRP